MPCPFLLITLYETMSNNRQRTKSADKKKDITLMTLLANESTSDARKLLKKYNKPDAQSHEDLEVKLAQLYFETPDKVALEKEMAEIHPHKKWLLKNIQPIEEPLVVKTEEIKVVELAPEITSNIEGCGSTSCPKCNSIKTCDTSSADGITQQPIIKQDYIPLLALMSIVTIGIIAISKK